MKKLGYVITKEFGHDRVYLYRAYVNSTYDDPEGATWGDFETFAKVQKAINRKPSECSIMIFDCRERADYFCYQHDIKDYVVREILFDFDDGEVADTRFCSPGMSNQVMEFLNRK